MSNLTAQPFTLPNLYLGKFVDKEGNLTPSAISFLTNLINQLQGILTPEGFFVPQQTSTNITTLNTAQSIGAFIFNNTTNKFQLNMTGTFKDILTS